MNGDKPPCTLVAHVGIIGHDRVLVSLAAPLFINGVIKNGEKLSINIVDEEILPQEDYAGSVCGAKEDKLYFGDGSLQYLNTELPKYGKNVVLIYGGGSIKKNGIYDEVVKALEVNGKIVAEISGVMPNPTLEKLYEGVADSVPTMGFSND